MSIENDSQPQAESLGDLPEDAIAQVALPIADRVLICQLLNAKTGVRSEPFSGTLGQLQGVFEKAVEEDRSTEDHYVICLMDKLYEGQEDMNWSSLPVVTVSTFNTIGVVS